MSSRRSPLPFVLSAALVVAVGLLFLVVRSPLAASFERLAPAPAPPVEAPLEAPPIAAPPPPAAQPEPVRWTLLDLEAAVQEVGVGAEALVAEARAELGELDDPARAEPDRRQRTLRRWALWSRTWRNRLEDLEGRLPPPDSCAVHAAMRPACEALREIFAQLTAVPETLGVDAAVERLDDAAARLEALLRPPEPEPELDEDGNPIEPDPDEEPAANADPGPAAG